MATRLRVSSSLLLVLLSVGFASAAVLNSPTVTADLALITPPATLERRNVQNTCGAWTGLDADDASQSMSLFRASHEESTLIALFAAYSWWCGTNDPCMIDTYTYPNIVYCDQPWTTFFDYGNWPAGGCNADQNCW